jgi:lysozyme
MAKRKTNISRPSKPLAKKRKTPTKYYVLAALFSLFVVSLLLYGNGLQFEFLKLKSRFISYKNNYVSNAEKNRIHEIIAHHKDGLFGIDISHYQGIINWEKVDTIQDSIPVKFVLIRATMGEDSKDKYFNYNWQEASKKNFIVGAYHYYRPNENSTKQANLFIEKVKLQSGHLAPVLDIEELPKVQVMDSLKKGLLNWLELTEKHFGKKPIIYTGDSYYADFLKTKEFESYPLWIANYNKIKEPKNNNWLFWQFTDKGKINGINSLVDINIFDGNEKSLKLLTLE